jgi:hypothetical protein
MTDSLNKYHVISEKLKLNVEVLAKGEKEVEFVTIWLLDHPGHMIGTVRSESIFASPN